MSKVIGTASDILIAVRDWAKGKFVAKESGKGLSTNDYTTTEKTKLGGIASGAQVNVIEGVQFKGAGQSSYSDATISSKKAQLDLSGYALKSEISSVYRYKGSKTWAQLLAITSAVVGDSYNITDADPDGETGANWVCKQNVTSATTSTTYGTYWDKIGGTIDLSGYALKTDLSGYVPTTRKVAGHALSADVTVSKSDVGLGNVTNNAQVKGLSSGTTADHVVTWGADGYTVKDSGKTIATSVPANAKFTDTISTGTTSGSGNAVTSVSVSNGAFTFTKGETFLKYNPTTRYYDVGSGKGLNVDGVYMTRGASSFGTYGESLDVASPVESPLFIGDLLVDGESTSFSFMTATEMTNILNSNT